MMHQEIVNIDGPQGRLSAELSYGSGRQCAAALLLSPHPYMGGRMKLPLMDRLADQFAQANITSLRFDYGGVGLGQGPPIRIGPAMQQFWSTGSAPDDPVHIAEGACAKQWLQAHCGGPMMLVGYSFGAYVATRLCDQNVASLVMIAPTIARHDYSGLCNSGIPTLIVYGDGDFATSQDELTSWADRLPGRATLLHVSAGDHFFRGQEEDVARRCREFIEEQAFTQSEIPS
ncbi:MAG: hypothetical protein NTV94_04385 [Planctomycetota bacterium]|nr:hypothetical protein [Planctomycetota bacterium]